MAHKYEVRAPAECERCHGYGTAFDVIRHVKCGRSSEPGTGCCPYAGTHNLDHCCDFPFLLLRLCADCLTLWVTAGNQGLPLGPTFTAAAR